MPKGTTKATRRYPSLPSPGDTVESHTVALRQMKEALEIHERRTKDLLASFVRLEELVDLDIVNVRGTQIVRPPFIEVPLDGTDGYVLTYADGAATWAAAAAGGGGGGVTDHGALTGLPDDDHTQYLLRSVFTTNGDMLYQAGGVMTRLGIGTDGQVLTLASGLPTWATPSGGAANSLETEILADSPSLYYICDETTGTTIADSSGGGYDMTVVSGVTLDYSTLDDTAVTHPLWGSGTADGASISGVAGITVPMNGDWTIEALVVPQSTAFMIFGNVVSGETEATNVQLIFQVISGNLSIQWESGAGVNTIVTGPSIEQYNMQHLAARKDGTANTIDFFINGVMVRRVSYATEPTGGSSINTYLGNATPVTSNGLKIMGHVALYDAAQLTDARIRAHAVAAGVQSV